MKLSECLRLLGVSDAADETEIKRAYRKLAQKWHPDRNAGSKKAEERFKEIKLAYEILSDPQKREAAGNLDKAQSFGFGAGEAFSNACGSVFNDFFGFKKKDQKKGENVDCEFEISLMESIVGSKRTAIFWRTIPCSSCGGRRGVGGANPSRCRKCGGHGATQGGLLKIPCSPCGGTGVDPSSLCGDCGGTGLLKQEKKLELKIPAGIDDGVILRASGEGHWPNENGSPGDFLARIKIAQDPVFTKKGGDLHRRVFVDCLDAILGGTMKISHPMGGQVSILIPPGTQSGDVICAEGMGCLAQNAKSPGDMVCEVEIQIARDWSPSELMILQLARAERQGRGTSSI